VKRVQRCVLLLAVAGSALISGCSVSAATDHVATLDGPGRQACIDARTLAQDLSGGSVSPAQARERAGHVYQEAQASSNPILAAKAVVLYTDSTSGAMGGGDVHLRADLQSLSQSCATLGG
jgi:hypothetical protein